MYQSSFSSIYKEDGVQIQEWSAQLPDTLQFQQELLSLRQLYFNEKPKKLLIDISQCKLVLEDGLQNWMGENILLPLHQNGVQEIQITRALDTTVHRSVVNGLEKAKSIVQAQYFENKQAAMVASLKREKNISTTVNPLQNQASTVKGAPFTLAYSVSLQQLPLAQRALERIESQSIFIESNRSKFYQLTPREREILVLLAQGKTNKQIGEQLFIEESSVKTHRKHIKSKLRCASSIGFYQYAFNFGLID